MQLSLTRVLLFSSLLLALAGCASAPITATMDFDRQYDFSGVQKIAIQPIDRTTPGTVIISDMQVDRIHAALASELQRQGFQVVTSNADADMLLTWHLVTQDRTDVRSFNSSARYNCWNCSASSDVRVRQYTQGTFIVDMIDPIKLRSVWRGMIESRLRDEPDSQKAAENRAGAAQAIFAGFPPTP